MTTKSKDKLLKAAITTLAQNPRASLDEIAQSAEISRATLYRHFKSRELLMKELSLEAHRQVDTALKPIFAQKLSAERTLELIVSALIPLGASFHFLTYEPWHSDDKELQEIYEVQMQTWQDLATGLRDEGVITRDMPIPWIAFCLDSLIFTAWVSIRSGDVAPNGATELVLTTFLRGCGVPEEKGRTSNE